MTYLASRILKDPGFEIAPLKRGFPKTKNQYVIGFDTEAQDGEPFLLQVGHPGGKVHLFDVTPATILDTLLRHVDETATDRGTTYTLFGFHLAYEYTQLFQSLPEISWGFSEVIYETGWYKLLVYNEKRHTFFIRLKGNRTVRVLDAMAFIPTSLARASEVVGVGQKDEKPPVFSRSQRYDPDFIHYSEQDARLTQALGEYIVGLHREQDVPLSLSASHFAAQVYRRRYLVDSIPRPSEELEQLGLECYHGGKNAYYLPAPEEYARAYAYDIRSAYSEAMAGLPDVESGIWETCQDIVLHSIVRARITYRGCRYRPLWALASQPTRTEIATTGYELLSAMECGCIEVHDVRGYQLVGPPFGSLWRYVQDFYDMKRHATTGAQKVAAKLFLNGLYGKFFQKVPLGKAASFNLDNGQYTIHDYDQPYDYLAGGLYHPPIASLITGFVRAKIHTFEHRYRAIMTSTDGIFGTQFSLPADVGDDLGKLEAQSGRLRVWRERLYIFDSGDHPKEECQDQTCDQHKIAKHGFRGTPQQLAAVPLQPGLWEYAGTQGTTLRMAMHGKHRPGQFVDQPFHVQL